MLSKPGEDRTAGADCDETFDAQLMERLRMEDDAAALHRTDETDAEVAAMSEALWCYRAECGGLG